MIADIKIADKSFGDKKLYHNLAITIERGEKVGLIGRNGTGKSTLFQIMIGVDQDFDGEVILSKGTRLIAGRQEHHGFEDLMALEYVLGDLPEYTELKHIIDTYPDHMGADSRKIQRYSDALERFSDLGYYEVENDIAQILDDYQIEINVAHTKLGSLSGGQKRMIELIKVQRARADLALIDEPTNHMDYVAKTSFIQWLRSAQEAVLVITHDRDVLGVVDRIIEIRDGKAQSFKGNYDQYLRANTEHVTAQVHEFGLTQRRIANLQADITRFRRLKERSRDPGTIHRFKSLEQRATQELEALSAIEKPTFWIDRESADNLGTKIGAAYDEHKARNIRLRTKKLLEKSERCLIRVHNLSLGYGDESLFTPIDFELRVGGKIELKGRNGAGKTTLVRTILDVVHDQRPPARIFTGTIEAEKGLRIGVYEQEIDEKYLPLTLGNAIEQMYLAKDLPINTEKIKQLLSDYLFNPHTDSDVHISRLSGGQKARFQLISMLAGDPQVLILDEPTNHLDLPSIEELEDALGQYHGAILYISHDSYFTKHSGGETVLVAH